MRRLQTLIQDHIRELGGAEFKLAVYLYQRLERSRRIGGVEMNIAELSQATGVSWKQTQKMLKNLNRKGILMVEGGRGRTTRCRLPVVVSPAESGPAPGQEGEEPKSSPTPTATLSGPEPSPADQDAIGLPPVLTPPAAAEHLSETGVVEAEQTKSPPSSFGQESRTVLQPSSPSTAATTTPDPDREAIELITRICARPDAAYLQEADGMAGGRDKLLQCLKFMIERQMSFSTGGLLLCSIYDQCHIPYSELADWVRHYGKK